MKDTKARRVVFKVLKIFGWIVFSIVMLLVLIALAIQIPWVQNKIKQQAISFIQNKIGTPVSLDHFSLSFPKKIVLEGFYMEDQQRDTLLYAGRLGVDTDLWGLTDNVIDLKKIELENLTTTIKRSEVDSAFNFDYIIAAFVAPDTAQADTTAVAWDFKVGDVDLKQIRLKLADSLSGNHVGLRLGELTVDMETFDLNTSTIGIDVISLADVKASIVQTKQPLAVPDSSEVVPEDSAAVAFNIGFNTINVSNIDVDYNQKALGQLISFKLPQASVEANIIDIKNQVIDLSRISLENLSLAFQQMEQVKPPNPVSPEVQKHDAAQAPWKVTLAALDLTGSSIRYNDDNMAPVSRGMDFNHLGLSNLNTRVRNLQYDGENISAAITQFAFREKSGFRLRSFRASLAMLADSLAVDNLSLVTDNSRIAMEAFVSYPSLEALSTNPSAANFALNMNSSVVSLKDVLYFNPAVLDSLPLSLPQNSIVRLDGRLEGNVNDLNIRRLQVHMLESTSLFANGNIENLMDPEKMAFNLVIDRFYSTDDDVYTLVVDSLIPPTIEMPQWVSLRGTVKGTIKTPDVKTTLTSNLGTVHLDGKMNLNEGIKENYRGELRIHEFNVGRLLKQPDQMGTLDMVATVNGAGLSIEELDALFKVRVNKFIYGGYTYRDFRVDGSMKKYFFSGKASLRDENLNFVLTGDLDYNEEVPHYALDLDLKNADFKKLKFTARPLKARGKLEVDMKTADFQTMNGDLGIRKFAVYNGEALYAVDSLLFASIDQEGQSEISIRSDIVSGDFKGTINIFKLPDLLNRHFNQYFSLRDTVYSEPVADQNFKFDLVIKNTDLITEILLPGLEPFVPGKIQGEFNSAESLLKIDIGLSEISYTGIGADSISLKVLTDPESFDFTFAAKEILIDTLNIKMIRLAGNVMHDSIRTNLMILDSLEEEKYFLGGVFHSFEDAFQFSFLKNHVVLNYEPWESPRYNSLRFTAAGLDPNNFYIQKGEERILLLKKNNADSTLSVVFNEVDLKNITSLVEGTTPVGGIIDGELTLSSAKVSSFDTEMTVKNLSILERTWGDLALLVNKKGAAPMNFNMALQGENVEMKANGFLSSDEEPVILLRASMPKLDLSIIEPLTMGQLKELKGTLSGELMMQGKTADPQMSGRVTFRETSFISSFTNTAFAIPNETIYLRDEDLVFDRFEILDDKKNKAVLDGLITSRKEGGFLLRLNLNSRNFQLLNTTEDDNELFYGNIRLNTKASITGTSYLPVIRMDISLAENSELTYVVPQSEKGVMDQKGIVVFIDRDALNDPFMKSIDPRDTVKAGFTGFDLTANIELTDTEKFNVVIDPVTGDRLSVQGNSTLTLHMDATGDMQLTGRYEISSGTYDLSFAKFMKRNFTIEKGSTITWSGDPMTAEMNIRAMYEVETAPVELVSNEVSDDELDAYKKEVPFQVYLLLKGELMFPEISFELSMPEEDRDEFSGNVYAKLQDVNTRESDLNKQVFALLVLKRFMSDNPFESEGGGDLASSARKSVSRMLSEQLNRLSSNVKGLELSFDLKSYDDYSRGSSRGQTELELGVSKSMMNDRLIVKVSGNVGLEGESTNQDSFTDFIGDLALEYKLTPDGRLRVTGFRNSSYDMINGDLIETGAGLIYIKDYDTLSELFKANAKKK